MDEIQSQIQELSDNIDNTISDISDSIESLSNNQDDLDARVTDTEEKAGQLEFPLTQESIDLIKQCFPTGTATLASGTVTIQDQNISPNSIVMITVSSPSGSVGNISYTASQGSMVVSSTSSTDNSTFNYVVFS